MAKVEFSPWSKAAGALAALGICSFTVAQVIPMAKHTHRAALAKGLGTGELQVKGVFPYSSHAQLRYRGSGPEGHCADVHIAGVRGPVGHVCMRPEEVPQVKLATSGPRSAP